MSQEEAWLMVSVMKDVVRRGTAAGSVGPYVRAPNGGKTGTTNDGTDVWYVGYTPDLVAGVWMGFDKPKRIKGNAQGGQLAAPAFTAFVGDVYSKRRAPADWPMPPGIVTREVDVTTNMLASAYCPRTMVGTEFFVTGTDPMYSCDVHTVYNLYPDTLGLYPPGSYPPGTVPPGTPPAVVGDTFRPLAVPPPGTRDTTRLPPRDSGLPPRTVFPRRDTIGRPDSIIRPRPDTMRPRRDTLRPRPDTVRPRPDTMRPPPPRPPDTLRTHK
jgi:penicillin-binding protein 1A